MATERTTMTPQGQVIFLDENKDAMNPSGEMISFSDLTTPSSGFQAAWANNATITQGLQGIS